MSLPGERIERCETCRFWAPVLSECHRHAPTTLLVLTRGERHPVEAAAQSKPARVWPITVAEDWCGDWAASLDAAHKPEQDPTNDVALRIFLARVAPALDTRNPGALVESLLQQLPSDVRRVLVLTNGLEGHPRAGLKVVARELKMSQGHVRVLLATGEKILADVVRLLTCTREKV
jgi:hypothetical protein